MHRLALSSALVALLCACPGASTDVDSGQLPSGQDAAAPDAQAKPPGQDAALPVDASIVWDASQATDAAGPPDAAELVDATTAVDAAMLPDASTAPDAAAGRDAGTGDVGMVVWCSGHADNTPCGLDGGVGTCCSSSCADLSSSPWSCGACGHSCELWEHCTGSKCMATDCATSKDGNWCRTGADGGVTGQCCSGACVDLNSDSKHCGKCATACGAGEDCASAVCSVLDCSHAPTNQPCDRGSGARGTCCRGQCRDLGYYYNSDQDCGWCGATCPSGTSCQQLYPSMGACAAAGVETPCGYNGHDCPAGMTCSSGKCLADSCTGELDRFPCSSGQCCGQACVNVGYDPQNCGACGQACGTGSWCDGKCQPLTPCDPLVSGAACPISDTHPGVCCQGACVDIETDSQNCAVCGQVCPTGSTCRFGCYAADGTGADCNNTGCPAGLACYRWMCLDPSCVPGSTGSTCGFGPGQAGTCCDGTCTAVYADPESCGKCGHSCGTEICAGSPSSGAQCFPVGGASSKLPCSGGTGCPANERCWISQCLNCTDYPSLCSKDQSCVDGLCVGSSCDHASPGAFCDKGGGKVGVCCSLGLTGCTDTHSDANNCGTCGWRCAPGQTCVGGACVGTPVDCGAGHRDEFCDLVKGFDWVCCAEGCVDLTSTATSCGSCGNVCSAGLDCVAGKCKATQCSAANEGKPCIEGTLTGTCCSSACVDLATDENNCGHCDTACPSILTCANYGCGLDSCDATQNGLPCHLGTSHQLGQCCQSACVDTQSDPANCNGCGLPCPNGKQCVAGSCK